ncbi:MAG: urease accessory protein UreD, partial [Synechococcus sp.]
MTDTPDQMQPWRGSVSLRFAPAADGTTQWQGGARSPLKLLRHFTAGDGRCVMPLLHTAGGLVGGDQLEIDLHAAAGSRSFLTSVAAQKIYGSRGRSRVQPQGRWAQISLQAELEAGADLEWLPQETVVFAGALLEQQQ